MPERDDGGGDETLSMPVTIPTIIECKSVQHPPPKRKSAMADAGPCRR
jgi:hypothetical protein